MALYLPRLHLFEFHDLEWFPPAFRDGTTECLRVFSSRLALERVIAPLLSQVVRRSGATRIVDMCSGSCGPVVPVARLLAESGTSVEIIVTDKYPNDRAFTRAEKSSGGLVRGWAEPVDARDVPAQLGGVRTLFNAFHHFRPEEARDILRDAYSKRQPIAVFEITNRSLLRTLLNFPASFLLMLGTIPLMRPQQFVWWYFAYVLPVLPFTFAWDGLVSCLRSYREEEYRELTAGLGERYEWKFGVTKAPRGPLQLTWLTGTPTE